MTGSFDIAIIGGGLAGCSTALHARLKGASVVLVERGRCGAQASGVNYGGVRQQGRHPAELALARRSRTIWGGLKGLIGTDCEFTATGHLKLARDDDDMAELVAHHLLLGTHGIQTVVLGPDDLKVRFPYLSRHYAGGSFCAEDGQANPRLVAPAFARAARALGADIREGSRVIGAEPCKGGFSIRLDNDPTVLTARRLVNTAGAWGAAIAAQFGDHVDETVMAPNMCVTEPIAPLIGPNLGICGGGIYIRQAAHGSVIFGAGLGIADQERLRARPLAEITIEAAAAAVAMVPQLKNVLLLRSWTGIEGRMPDGLPIVGPSPTVEGLFHAFGFSGHGFQLGPAVGAVLAELSLDGHSPTSISGLAMTRFIRAPAAAVQS
ncbi:FAD-dependent oxidoreductase [Rhizobium sp. R72]|uniref:NAD(P)/FAD-dependent oxidoreductase n=1 Tax=unclassified Rhizobium TaxID=2613769 RepID=UPI000B52F5CB|nr:MULTISPECIES: FAD-binding oxidoreductase [unclassified Rhizobium]OWW02362.1 FAD-dependent oxidoreductase [Rhizobium sp. R72]OWW02496.1 FAD-dependent oxidoreductase [Rhizobium sp. R711]